MSDKKQKTTKDREILERLKVKGAQHLANFMKDVWPDLLKLYMYYLAKPKQKIEEEVEEVKK